MSTILLDVVGEMVQERCPVRIRLRLGGRGGADQLRRLVAVTSKRLGALPPRCPCHTFLLNRTTPSIEVL